MEQGIVHYRNLQKGLYIVKLALENYAVFETYDIMAFKVGDAVFGNFSKCGVLDLLNATTLCWTKVNIQNIGCNESVAMDKANLTHKE